jgi:hypothetical protein
MPKKVHNCLANLKAGPEDPARTVCMVAVTVLLRFVFNLKFACVLPHWDGLVQSNWELEHHHGMAGPPASLAVVPGPRRRTSSCQPGSAAAANFET